MMAAGDFQIAIIEFTYLVCLRNAARLRPIGRRSNAFH